jgi:hypothetical protein
MHACTRALLPQCQKLTACVTNIREALYPLTSSAAATELDRALVHLYAAIMVYLSKAKSYFEQNSASRFIHLPLRIDADAPTQNVNQMKTEMRFNLDPLPHNASPRTNTKINE